MKKFVLVLMLLPITVLAQKGSVNTPPTLQDLVTQNKRLQDQNNMQAIQLAQQTYASAASQLQIQVDKQLAPLDQAVATAVIKARDFRGLSPAYLYNPQTKDFEKPAKPNPLTPASKVQEMPKK